MLGNTTKITCKRSPATRRGFLLKIFIGFQNNA
nr:MAG TPA: hypothetical protein [Caudoviricetes sp.]